MPGKHAPFQAVVRLLAVVALSLSVPILAHANSINFSNSGGTIAFNSGTGAFSLTGSGTTFEGSTGYFLGFSTQGPFSGTLGMGCTTAGEKCGSWGAGGTFTITEKGVSGAIFSGTFSGPVSWTSEGCNAKENCEYQLQGAISGTYSPDGKNGPSYQITLGSTTQIDLTTTGTGPYMGVKGTLKDELGSTNMVTPIPEPGSLGLMGTGLIGLAFTLKRKVKDKFAQQL
jgi:hypothetical protein